MCVDGTRMFTFTYGTNKKYSCVFARVRSGWTDGAPSSLLNSVFESEGFFLVHYILTTSGETLSEVPEPQVELR